MTAAPVIRKGAALAAALLVLILAVLGGAVLSALSTLPDPLFAADYSTVVLDENGAILRVFLNSQEQLILPDDGRPIPPKLQAAVITYEDKRFERHWGVDPLAVIAPCTKTSAIETASAVPAQSPCRWHGSCVPRKEP